LAFVPIIVSNRRRNSYGTRGGNTIAAVVVSLLVFGLLFLVLFNRFNGFSIPITVMLSGMGVFIIMIIIISVIAASMSGQNQNPKFNSIKTQYYQPQYQSQRSNPYVYRRSIQKEPEDSIYTESKSEISDVSTVNYCRFCGAKVDKDAIFCHQCGINLSS